MAKNSNRGQRMAQAHCAVWEGERLLEGFYTIGRVEAELGKSQENPTALPRMFEKARYWFQNQWFVRAITLLRYAFFHYGFTLKAEGDGGRKTEDRGREAVKTWERNNRKAYRRYAREAWLEWLVQDNVIGLWREAGLFPPLIWPVECCKFQDVFGVEQLKLTHGMTEADMKAARLKPKERELLTNDGKMTLQHGNGVFEFEV